MINFSPTHLTSVETDKGKINVEAKKVTDDSYQLIFGYPQFATMHCGYGAYPDILTVYRTETEKIYIPKGEIDKVLAPIL